MSFKNRAILFSRTFSCANQSNSRGLYICAGVLRETQKFHELSYILRRKKAEEKGFALL